MHSWGRCRTLPSPLPSPLCGCTGKIRAYFRACHGSAVCCNVFEGEDCMLIDDEKNAR